ncbi:hypothetical protein ACOMHN_056932 [Nucella lapillus]
MASSTVLGLFSPRIDENGVIWKWLLDNVSHWILLGHVRNVNIVFFTARNNLCRCPVPQGISGRHALRALRIAERVERSGASFASVHRPRVAQPFLPHYGASSAFSAVCGCLGDWRA